jgi:hypothetical protein
LQISQTTATLKTITLQKLILKYFFPFAIFNFFKGHFPKKINKKVNSQKRPNHKKEYIKIHIRASKFEKIGKCFSQVFKMAVIVKMAENWFFDHDSVSFIHICILFYDLSLYFSRIYFEQKFIVRFNMASGVQDGGQKSKSIFQYFCVLFLH